MSVTAARASRWRQERIPERLIIQVRDEIFIRKVRLVRRRQRHDGCDDVGLLTLMVVVEVLLVHREVLQQVLKWGRRVSRFRTRGLLDGVEQSFEIVPGSILVRFVHVVGLGVFGLELNEHQNDLKRAKSNQTLTNLA